MPRQKRRLNPDTVVFIKKVGVGFLVLSLTALIVAGVWYGSRLESLTISKVVVVGGETIDHQIIIDEVQANLAGTYLGLVPKRFAWFYPKEALEDKVGQIERVHNVSIAKIDGQTLQVNFSEFLPKALWCESSPTDRCVFLDSEGFAFAEAPSLAGGSLVRFFTTGEPVTVGNNLTDANTLSSLLDLIARLEGREWYVSRIELDQVGDAFVFLSGGGELKVSSQESPEITVGNLMTVVSSPDFAHIQPGNFAYIDLRFGNRVFVSEEGLIEPEEIETEIATGSEEIILPIIVE